MPLQSKTPNIDQLGNEINHEHFRRRVMIFAAEAETALETVEKTEDLVGMRNRLQLVLVDLIKSEQWHDRIASREDMAIASKIIKTLISQRRQAILYQLKNESSPKT